MESKTGELHGDLRLAGSYGGTRRELLLKPRLQERLGRLPADSGARESGRFPVDAQNEVVAVIFLCHLLD